MHSRMRTSAYRRRTVAAAMAAVVSIGASQPAVAQSVRADSRHTSEPSAAVVFAYHRFGEATHPAANIRLDQFETHLKELRDGGYVVLPLPDVIAALRRGEPLPDRTVSLTVDDAYASLYAEAWPRLKAAGLPFTVFVVTNGVDRNLPGYMSWDQLRELAASGLATIGSQTASHPHMPLIGATRNADELAKSRDRIAAEIGRPPTLFAYPYGEMSLAVKEAVRDAGFVAAFGQHSGVAHSADDRYFLPRFVLSEKFGDLTQFRTRARALALPVTDVVPADPFITGANPPAFGFTVASGLRDLGRLTCYPPDQVKLTQERLGERIELRLAAPLTPGRARINCTLPVGNDRWRWYGTQFLVPPITGQSPAD